VTGGDDYEVLATVPDASADAFQAMAAQAGIAVTRIGATQAGAGVVIEGRDGQPLILDRTGWDHF
jgi:thiamine-monophosphate kinase